MADDVTVAGPGGPVALSDVASVDMVLRPTKAHTCASCRDTINAGQPNLAVVATSGTKWRLCVQCAPQRLDGEEIACAKKGVWSAARQRRGGSG